jgi:protein SCO1/2
VRAFPVVTAVTLALTAPAAAQTKAEMGTPSTRLPSLLEQVGFDQRLGETVPLDAVFVDQNAHQVTLASYFAERPVLLLPAYFSCPVLCDTLVDRLAASLSVLDLRPGGDYEVLVVSFDPADTPQTAQPLVRRFLDRLRGPAAESTASDMTGIHFLTGPRASLAALFTEIGFRYVWDEQARQFLHGAGLVVLTPSGQIARYLFGLEPSPRDLRLTLVEASGGRIGSFVDQALLYCFRYDPKIGKYSAVTLNLVRLGGGLTLALLLSLVGLLLRRERLLARTLGTRKA